MRFMEEAGSLQACAEGASVEEKTVRHELRWTRSALAEIKRAMYEDYVALCSLSVGTANLFSLIVLALHEICITM